MNNFFEFTVEDQMIVRLSISWLLHGQYSMTYRPNLSDKVTMILSNIKDEFTNSYISSLPDHIFPEIERRPPNDPDIQHLPKEDLLLILLAVKSFYCEVINMKGEFLIITGLDPEKGELLISRLSDYCRS